MASIDKLIPSPDGELIHLQVRDKINEIIDTTNNFASKEIIIESVEDLPSPVDGFHPLENNATYNFRGSVTSSAGLKPGPLTKLQGGTIYRDAFVYTGSGSCIKSDGTLVETQNLSFYCTNGTFLEKTVDSGNIIIRRAIIDCKDFGTVRSNGIFLMVDSQVNFRNTGIKYGNAALPIHIINLSVLTNSTTTDPLTDFKGSNIGYSAINTVVYRPKNDLSAFCISADAASVNIQDKFYVAGCFFDVNPGQTILDGCTVGDIKYDFKSNVNLPDSQVIVNAYLASNTTETNLTQNVRSLISGNWQSDSSDQRTDTSFSGGRITYIGEGRTTMSVTVTGQLANVGNDDQTFRIQPVKLQSLDPIAQKIDVTVDGNDENGFSFTFPITVSRGEFFEIYITNLSGSQNAVIKDCQINGIG